MEPLIELRPALEDAVVTVKKPKLLESGSAGSGPRPGEKIGEHEGKYTRELKGVLTPLGRPILQGGSLLAYPARFHALTPPLQTSHP